MTQVCDRVLLGLVSRRLFNSLILNFLALICCRIWGLGIQVDLHEPVLVLSRRELIEAVGRKRERERLGRRWPG